MITGTKKIGRVQRAVVEYLKENGPTPIRELYESIRPGRAFSAWRPVVSVLESRKAVSVDETGVVRLLGDADDIRGSD